MAFVWAELTVRFRLVLGRKKIEKSILIKVKRDANYAV